MIVNVEDYSLEANFWELYPSLALAGCFAKLYKSDKSRNKEVSSRKMWAVVFIWDRNSKYYNLPEDVDDADSKITLIFEELFEDKHFYKKNKELFDELKSFYLKLQETPSMRSLRELEEQLEERSKFLKSIAYSIGELDESGKWIGGTAELKDKMMANTGKLYELLDKAKATVENEKATNVRNKGNEESSLSDSNRI